MKYIDIANAYSLREYIEVGNTAGPYINTRLFWSQSNEFEVKAQFMAEPENDTFVFGCWVSYLDTNIAYGNGWQIIVGGSGITGQQYDTNAHVYKAEQNSLLLDGSVLSGTPNWNNVPTNVPIAIFTDGARLTEKRIKNTRVYYAKIWDNGELTHYFVPAIRKSDDEIGMLDIMTSTFYDNDGSGDFTISSTERTDIEGKPIISSFAKVNDAWQNLIGTDIDAIQSGGEGESPILFKNYAKFDGSQGIILPWKINADYKVEVTFYQTTYTDAENIIGNTSGAVYSHLTPYQGGYWSSLGSNEGLIPNLSWSAGEHTYITNNGNGYNEFDGVEVQSYTPTTINGYYTIGERASTSIIRSYIKSYKIYSISQGTLLHELVPCLYDGVTPCLYDKVGKMFFCNGIESVMDTIPTT